MTVRVIVRPLFTVTEGKHHVVGCASEDILMSRRIAVGVAVSAVCALMLGEPLAQPSANHVQRVVANGVEFAYEDSGGTRDPVVFVHGGLQDYRMWELHRSAFAERYRVIAYSRRNHFPNATSGDGTPDAAADIHGADLAAFIQALHLRRPHIVAHSSGAHAALFFAIDHPGLLRTLVVNEPPATGLLIGAPGGAETLASFTSRFAAAREAFRAQDLPRGLRLFADAVGGSGTYDRRSESQRRMMMDNALAHVADATTTRPRPVFNCEMARRIRTATLLSNGERSPDLFHRIVDELERCMSSRERITVAGASHTVPLESPVAYREAVLAFLARH